jgi:hypothetical protein
LADPNGFPFLRRQLADYEGATGGDVVKFFSFWDFPRNFSTLADPNGFPFLRRQFADYIGVLAIT